MFCKMFGRSRRHSSGSSNRCGSRFAAPFITSTLLPARTSTWPILLARRTKRKFDLIGLSKRSISSTKAGILELSWRSCSCKSGRCASISIAGLSRSIVVPRCTPMASAIAWDAIEDGDSGYPIDRHLSTGELVNVTTPGHRTG